MKILQNVIEKNIMLTGKLMRYMGEHPHIFEALPDDFQVVILPDDDPEIRQYNFELLDKQGSEGKPVVFVRMHIHSEKPAYQPAYPNFYVPIAA